MKSSPARSAIKRAALQAVLPLAALAVWEVSARAGWIDPLFFPAPSRVLARLVELLKDGSFQADVARSFWRLALGAALAAPAAVGLGLALGLHPAARRLADPLIALTYPIPKIAVFPLLMVVFGIGEASKVAVIAVSVFYLVLLSVLQGCRRLYKEDYMDIVTVFGIPYRKKLLSIALPGCLPEAISGLKMGLGYGLVMVVASEFTFSDSGLGFFIWRSWDQFRVLDIYCGLAVLAAAGFLIFRALDAALRRTKGYDPDF
jgi:ABC-type nitrate/sulfonate/bicarbonate transport system permease component